MVKQQRRFRQQVRLADLNHLKKLEENLMISYDRAFLATYYVLNEMFQKTPSDSLAVIASDMNPFLFVGMKSADPASYEDFVDCCKEVEKQENYGEDVYLAYRCGLAYMQFFHDSWGYPLEDEIKRFSFEDFKKAYEKAAQTTQ